VLEILSANINFIARGFCFWDLLTASVLTYESLATIEECPLVILAEEGPKSGRILRADEGPPIRVVKKRGK
jgi:inosine-uridine nucleoside N-ribohydrolase